MENVKRSKPRKLILAIVFLGVFACFGFRLWWIRSDASGSDLGESRHLFHRLQMEFKSRCERGVVGCRIEEVLPLFGGLQSFGGGTYSWKEWPCDLVVVHGVVAGVFYHDFPFKTQPVPSSYRLTHALPYFERHPEFLKDGYAGRWDGKGGYIFEKSDPAK